MLRILVELGAETLDADEVVHATLAPDGKAYHAVVRRWGVEVLNDLNEIDRSRLGRIVFADSEQLRELERLVHPHVHAVILEKIHSASRPLVVDALKLVENGLSTYCDHVWVVTCTPQQQLERLMRRNHLSEADARLRIQAQPSLQPNLQAADVVIDNSGTVEQTRRQVVSAWEQAQTAHGCESDPSPY